MKNPVKLALAIGLYTASAAAQDTACATVLVPAYSPPVVASGWQAQLVVGGLTSPRSIQFDSTGALLVVERGKGISRHRFQDDGGTCLSANHSHMLVEMSTLNHGLTLSSSGDTLYASSAEAVFAWPYNARAGAVTDASNPRTVVANMSNSDLITRTLLVSRAHPGMLLVSRGSAEDDAARTEVLANGLSQIKVFNLTNLTEGREYNFNEDGLVLGWGLRNSVGVAEHPVTGGVYAVENSVDGVHRNGVDVHENNPGEELNFLGYVNGTGTGKNFGYPTCFAVWKVDEIPDNDGLGVGKQFAVQETGTNRDETCAEKYQPPRLTFPAHYAPIDIEFDGNGKEAFVSFRGSFDRSSPVGYRVSSISFNPSTGDPVASTDSTNALAADIITNKDNSVCPDKCFRPVGLAFDSQGRLWMASDSTGEIYVLQKTGEGGEGKFVGADGNNDGGQGTGEENAAAGRGALGLGWVLAAGVGAWLAMA